jgi:DNA-binding transcriptional LysR family regulator
MTLEQIRYFADIAEYGSFSGAADRWYISQPAVSKQIRSMEEELGCKLFDRQRGSGKRIALTEIGQQVYPSLKRMLDQYEAIIQDINVLKKYKQLLRVSAAPIIDPYGISKILTQFEEHNGDIQIQLIEYEEQEAIINLITGESDIAVIREELFTARQFDTFPLVPDYLSFFCDAAHPLAVYHTISIDQIANEPLALSPDNTYVGRYSMELFRKKGIIPRVVSRIRPETIVNNLEKDHYSTLLFSKYYNINPSPRIKVIPLDPPCVSTVILAYRKNSKKNDVIERLIGFMGESFSPGQRR